MCVCVSEESLLTLCIFNELYYHDSEDQDSFSVGFNPKKTDECRILVRRSAMLPRIKLSNRQHLLFEMYESSSRG